MKPFFIKFLSLLITCNTVVTQAQQINIRKYSVENGLVNNDILKIYNDSQGFMWLCTLGGLSRYDGSRFLNYTTANGLTNDMINAICEIAPQEFIVAQNLNGARLLKNGQLQPLSPYGNITLNAFYTVDKTRLLATTDLNGVVEWNNGHLKPLNPAHTESIGRMAALNDSTWLILQEHLSVQLTTPFLEPLSPRAMLDATFAFTDSRHRTWLGTTHGLQLLDPGVRPGKPIVFIPLPPSFDLPILRESYISDFLEDSQGNYWIGTNKGLVRISQDKTPGVFTEQDGLPVSIINCIKEDRQNNIWVGTPLGLAKFSLNNEIKTFALNLGLSHDGTALISPLTENNLRLFDGKNIHYLDLLSGRIRNSLLIDSFKYRIYQLDKEHLLVIDGLNGMIYRSRQESAELIRWPAMEFDAIAGIDQQIFLASHSNRLFAVLNGKYEEKLELGVDSRVFNLIIDQKNMMWAGTQDSGLVKISISGKDHSLMLKTIDTIISRLPDTHIRTLYADRENELWIGTRYKGVIRLLELPGGKYEIQNYGTGQGLSSDFVRAINRDGKGNIWVGTAQGIDKLIPTVNGYRIFNFGKVNSFFSPVHDICLLKGDYLLTVGSNIMYVRDAQQDTLPPPPVYITNMYKQVNDIPTTANEQRPRLPYNKAQIDFEFSAPQFINENFTVYSYRLLGSNDTGWSVQSKSRSIYFANLRPGNYTFEVRALGFNGKWGQPAVYDFAVNSPFWQKAWFILLVTTAIAVLMYAFYRYRVRQLIRVQKMRNRIATDLHDEIGSNLTNISILSSLSKRNLSEPSKTYDFLQRISEEVSSSSQALDDIVWSVNTNHDTLEETVARMRRYAAELFDATGTSYELYLDPAFEERKLPMEQRRDVYLLYKEAVNNVSKHAGAKQVSIQIAIEHNQLLLHIKDDGKGFEISKESSRHGLNGMKERVKKWKGKITIESVMKKGTCIQIRLPVSK